METRLFPELRTAAPWLAAGLLVCPLAASAQPITLEPPASLEVLTYNTWLLNVPGIIEIFTGGDSPCYKGRGRAIGRTLLWNHDFDLVLLQESFDDGARESMLYELDGKYPYVVQKRPDGSFLGDVNGGLTILSKYPFLSLWPLAYGLPGAPSNYSYAAEWKLPDGSDLCAGIDCYSNKGFLHVRIAVGGTTFSVLNLHMDADSSANDAWVRHQQMLQLREHLRTAQALFPNDVFIVGGDFNIASPCMLSCATCEISTEYSATLSWLFEDPTSGAELPAREAWREETCSELGGGAEQWGVDATGGFGPTSTCDGFFPGDCGTAASDQCRLPPGGFKAVRLDLLVFNDSHGPSILRTSEVRVERFGVTEAVGFCEDDSGRFIHEVVDYLSDHWGLAARFDLWDRYAPFVPDPGSCGPIPRLEAANPEQCGNCQCGSTDPFFCPADCPTCGDGGCGPCESEATCAADCGTPQPPPPPPSNCTGFDYSQCEPFLACQYFCEIGAPGSFGPSCCGCMCTGDDECPVCLTMD